MTLTCTTLPLSTIAERVVEAAARTSAHHAADDPPFRTTVLREVTDSVDGYIIAVEDTDLTWGGHEHALVTPDSYLLHTGDYHRDLLDEDYDALYAFIRSADFVDLAN